MPRTTGIAFVRAAAALLVTTPFAGAQLPVRARAKQTITVDHVVFKDLNANGRLDPYEDWRLAVPVRVRDLAGRMTLEEKAGMLLINTLNAEAGGRISDRGVRLIQDEKMTRFVFRNTVTPTPQPPAAGGRGGGFAGTQITAYEAAQFTNLVQELAEGTRLGIPAIFKSNARNHFERDARAGINVGAGAFSEWPKEPGLAAMRDSALVAEFGRIMRAEWSAIGLRGMYGYMADLATEPRWFRIHETFSEDADLTSSIITTLVKNIQGERLGAGSIAMTMKHFPGGGAQAGGADSHYAFGKNQSHPSGDLAYQLKPFRAAIAAGVSSIMPAYGIPVGTKYAPNDVGMAFSRGLLTALLRDTLKFEGNLNSDTGIIGARAWGLESKSVDEQIAIAVNAGVDVLSGFESNAQIVNLVKSGKITTGRLDDAVRRLLAEQFRLGLFEDPYVDADRASYLVGNRAFQMRAEEAQRKSIVLLQNQGAMLPFRTPTATAPVRVYTMGMHELAGDSRWNGYTIVEGDYDAAKGEKRAAVPVGTDYAVLRVEVSNAGANRDLTFGGANEDELNLLAFSDMAKAKSWKVSPSVEDIKAVMREAGAGKTVLAIYFRQPYVLDEASTFRNAGAILATFGVRDAAIMDVLTGKFKPVGKLPFALASNARAIVTQASDSPGYDRADTLFPFGFGLRY
ncbi:MAG: glycoside hydrolase family 3 N-terminal domain-containing protein [Gemmatimonadota bacterium]